jgi:hypothetical protein
MNHTNDTMLPAPDREAFDVRSERMPSLAKLQGGFHNGLDDLPYFLDSLRLFLSSHTPKALQAGSLLCILISKCTHCFRARS